MLISFHRFRSSGRGLARGRSTARGFTLVELLVVVVIIVVITSVFILQQRRFDSSTLLRSLAYSVALSVRQAQVYGTSVRQFGNTTGPTASGFNYSYGLYFSTGDLSRYYLFADVDGDKIYDAGEEVQTFNIKGGYGISQFCGILASGSKNCNAGSTGAGSTAISSLTIFFRRPNPDAQFSSVPNAAYSSAFIKVVGPSDIVTRKVTVTLTGQIIVEASSLGL